MKFVSEDRFLTLYTSLRNNQQKVDPDGTIPLVRHKRQRPRNFRFWAGRFVRARGIEPPTTAWKAVILPLNYARKYYCMFEMNPRNIP